MRFESGLQGFQKPSQGQGEKMIKGVEYSQEAEIGANVEVASLYQAPSHLLIGTAGFVILPP